MKVVVAGTDGPVGGSIATAPIDPGPEVIGVGTGFDGRLDDRRSWAGDARVLA